MFLIKVQEKDRKKSSSYFKRNKNWGLKLESEDINGKKIEILGITTGLSSKKTRPNVRRFGARRQFPSKNPEFYQTGKQSENPEFKGYRSSEISVQNFWNFFLKSSK